MKKLVCFATMLICLLIAGQAFAAGSVDVNGVKVGRDNIHIVFACTGDASDGSVPDTAIPSTWLEVLRKNNYYLVDVKTLTTAGGTDPETADVQVLESSLAISETVDIAPSTPRDVLLGAGANLIHPTEARAIGPAMPIYEPVSGSLSLRVVGQATASANYTVILVFSK